MQVVRRKGAARRPSCAAIAAKRSSTDTKRPVFRRNRASRRRTRHSQRTKRTKWRPNRPLNLQAGPDSLVRGPVSLPRVPDSIASGPVAPPRVPDSIASGPVSLSDSAGFAPCGPDSRPGVPTSRPWEHDCPLLRRESRRRGRACAHRGTNKRRGRRPTTQSLSLSPRKFSLGGSPKGGSGSCPGAYRLQAHWKRA
jgi:hypothetical protein